MALPLIYRPPITTNYADVYVSVDGWSTHAYDTDNTRWILTNLDGWSGTPAPRLAGSERSQDHGEFDAPSFYGPRIITVEGTTIAATRPLAMRARDIVSSVCAWDPSRLYTMTVVEPGQPTRRVSVRLSSATKVSPVKGGWFKWSLQLKAPDPRRYDDVESLVTLTPPTGATGGFTAPFTSPIMSTLTGLSTSSATLTNAGTLATRPVVTLRGPLVDPQIAHVGKGRSLSLTITLATDDVLVLDFDRRTVLLNGSASRSSTLRASAAWWELDPGGNDVAFTAGGGSGTAEIRYRSAWI